MTDYDSAAVDLDVRRYLELAAKAEEIAAEQNAIKTRLRGLGEGRHTAPCGVAVTVSPNRRFDPAKAQSSLPGELLDLCMKTAVDSSTAKRNLPPEIYEACMSEVGNARVSLR